MAMIARKSAVTATRQGLPARARVAVPSLRNAPKRAGVVARAEKTESADFDALLMKWANDFEKADNKPAIIGYGALAVGAFFFAEWLIHLPALDILLGWPIQLLGLLALPVAVVRYGLDGKDWSADAGDAVKTITKRLPGLDK